MENNSLIHLGLFLLTFVIIYKIIYKDSSHENLDSIDNTMYASGAQLPASVLTPSTAITVSPANAMTSDQLASTNLSTSGAPVVTSVPSGSITGANVPSPLTSVEETLLAAAPPNLPSSTSVGTDNLFAPTPVDMDALFSRNDTLDPADLIPKVNDSELYSGLQPDPRLNQNFLNNRWSLGIDTSISKRSPIYDIRGALPNPISASVLFNAPTIIPDVNRRGICDVS